MPSDPSEHYFSTDPAARPRPRRVRMQLAGERLELVSDTGLFSPSRVDPGTAVLLDAAPDPPPSGNLLDLGCGYGPIAVALAHASPEATVWAVDVNERALECCRDNADRLGLTNLQVRRPDADDLPEHVDLIWSNPPIRIGKPALHDLLSRWLGRLDEDGEAVFVVQKHLGADSLHRWLERDGRRVERIASKRGYRVFRIQP